MIALLFFQAKQFAFADAQPLGQGQDDWTKINGKIDG